MSSLNSQIHQKKTKALDPGHCVLADRIGRSLGGAHRPLDMYSASPSSSSPPPIDPLLTIPPWRMLKHLHIYSRSKYRSQIRSNSWNSSEAGHGWPRHKAPPGREAPPHEICLEHAWLACHYHLTNLKSPKVWYWSFIFHFLQIMTLPRPCLFL
jgi:hypothetical protein